MLGTWLAIVPIGSVVRAGEMIVDRLAGALDLVMEMLWTVSMRYVSSQFSIIED